MHLTFCIAQIWASVLAALLLLASSIFVAFLASSRQTAATCKLPKACYASNHLNRLPFARGRSCPQLVAFSSFVEVAQLQTFCQKQALS
jgi:hypothetical protein